MADEEQVAILKQGVRVWNEWRKKELKVHPNLSRINLRGADLLASNLNRANLHAANLIDARLNGAKMIEADLSGANLRGANLIGARLNRAKLNGAILVGVDLFGAKLGGASLRSANLRAANLHHSDLSDATLEGANLVRASLVDADLERANIANCRVYGISAWNLKLSGANQSNLVITPENEATITVDNLEVAQFIYLLLRNEKVRDVIDTITTKIVLILGHFSTEHIVVLDALRNEIRRRNYLPVLFDFDKPSNRDLTETISILAHLSRFIIADITSPRSIPQELQAIVPNLPSVPIQPILLSSQSQYGMFEHFTRFPWVLPIQRYVDLDDLLSSLGEKVIAPAEAKAKVLQKS